MLRGAPLMIHQLFRLQPFLLTLYHISAHARQANCIYLPQTAAATEEQEGGSGCLWLLLSLWEKEETESVKREKKKKKTPSASFCASAYEINRCKKTKGTSGCFVFASAGTKGSARRSFFLPLCAFIWENVIRQPPEFPRSLLLARTPPLILCTGVFVECMRMQISAASRHPSRGQRQSA